MNDENQATINGINQRLTSISRAMDHGFDKVNESFTNINSRIAQLEAKSVAPPDLAELFKALAAAQLEIENAQVNVDNEFLKTKYADLASVLDAVRKPLASNGLALTQLTDDPGNGVLGIRTILAHESGQTLVDHITMAPPKLDPQGIGSCRTYMRRYSILAICGIAGAADDDAEAAQGGPDNYPRITAEEAEKIIYTADELFGERADAAVAKMLNRVFGGISFVGDIREGEAVVALNSLKNAKAQMDKQAKAAEKAEQAEAKKAKAEK